MLVLWSSKALTIELRLKRKKIMWYFNKYTSFLQLDATDIIAKHCILIFFYLFGFLRHNLLNNIKALETAYKVKSA